MRRLTMILSRKRQASGHCIEIRAPGLRRSVAYAAFFIGFGPKFTSSATICV